MQYSGTVIFSLLLGVFVAATEPARATPDHQELFEQVFGQPQPLPSGKVRVPWRINRVEQGKVDLMIQSQAGEAQADDAQAGEVQMGEAQAGAISWSAVGFLAALGEAVQPELQRQLEAIAQQGNLSMDQLKLIGIHSEFDDQALVLDISLTPEQLRTNSVALAARARQWPQSSQRPTMAPARFSGYVNWQGQLGWDWISEQRPGRQPVTMSWDGVLNFEGWALEGRLDFSEGEAVPWRRGDLRLTRDWSEAAVRAIAGEISAPARGYQRSQPLLGMAISRQFALQPTRSIRPVSRYEFFLASPSQVELYINGQKEQTLDLPAGTQDLRDLALGVGINDIRLVVTDAVGRKQQLRFAAPQTAQLLAPGLEEFAYALGVPVVRGEPRRYVWSQPLLSAAHRWGLSDRLTAGAYLQAQLDQQLLGTQAAWATPLGFFEGDWALSHGAEAGLGYAGRIDYQYQRAGDAQKRRLALGIEYRSPRFLSLGETEPQTEGTLTSQISYGQTLFGSLQANLTAQHWWGGDRSGAYQFNLGLSQPAGPGRRLGLTFSHAQQPGGQSEQQLKLNFSLAFSPAKGHRLRLNNRTDLDGFQQRLGWSYSPDRSLNALRPSATLSYRREDWQLEQQLRWRGYRAEAELSQRLQGQATRGPSLPGSLGPDLSSGQISRETLGRQLGNWLSSPIQQAETRLRLGSAIAFADGHWGISRPISGSFALLAPHPRLRGQHIKINPSQRGAAAEIDRWGAAVLPGLPDYRLSSIELDAPELPLGYSLGPSQHRLRPGYRRGGLIQVGRDATVLVRGTLQTAAGEPVALQMAEVLEAEGAETAEKREKSADAEPTDVGHPAIFTNRAGKFVIEGLKPGNYRLRLRSGKQVSFSIPPDTTGLYPLGTLTLPPQE